MINCVVVGIGGAIGSILRYLISLIPIKESFLFPIKTFAVNIIGCFLIGCVVAFVSKNSTLNPKLVLFLKEREGEREIIRRREKEEQGRFPHKVPTEDRQTERDTEAERHRAAETRGKMKE